MANCELISCNDGGPKPPFGFPEDSYYVGVYDDQGTILSDFFYSKEEANNAISRLRAAGIEDV